MSARVIFVLFTLLASYAAAASTDGSLYCAVEVLGVDWSVFPMNSSECLQAAAWGSYNQNRFEIGWDQLYVETSPSQSDPKQAFAAGFLEGVLSFESIMLFYQDQVSSVNYSSEITTFFEAHLAWLEASIAANVNGGGGLTDPVWYQVSLMHQQFLGMLAGINSVMAPSQGFTAVQLLFVSSLGDLSDLGNKYPSAPGVNDWKKMSKHEFELWVGRNTHCSALVRLLPGHEDILFGHATWQTFSFALRVYKTMKLRFASAVAQVIQFSSYPAALVSTDDFHVLDSGFAVMETSLSVFNFSIYDAVTPQSLLSWMRVMVSNRLATSGASWAATFAQYNSGTYNNQWMIVDLNKFYRYRHEQTLRDGVLTIVEQMPGVVRSADVTAFVERNGFWPSYNIPFFTDLFDLAGYPAAIVQQGPEMLSYDKCVRAQIFAQRAPNVTSVEDLKFLLQYNDYQHDPISQGNPLYAIASRVDLTPSSIGTAQAFGALDAKASSSKMFFEENAAVYAYSGPTPQQPTFSFSNTTAQILGEHIGVPVTFNFSFQKFSPTRF